MDRNILIFGDSITWGASDNEGGWVDRLKQYCIEKSSDDSSVTVYNLGIPSEKSTPLLQRFEQELLPRLSEDGETVILIAVGINDSQWFIEEKHHTIEPSEFEESMKKLVTIAKKYTTQVILIGPTYVDESRMFPNPWKSLKGYKNDYIEKYNSMIKKLSEEENVHFIDILPSLKQMDWSNFLKDGLHPSTKGHEALFHLIYTDLKALHILN